MKQGEVQLGSPKARDRWQQRSRAFAVRSALAEVELERARQRIAVVERLVRHDVRTPLTVILGHAQMLAEGLVSPSRLGESYEVIQRQGARLNGLLEQLTSSPSSPESPALGTVAWVGCDEERVGEVQDALRGLPVCVCEPEECETLRETWEPLILAPPACERAALRAAVQQALAAVSSR